MFYLLNYFIQMKILISNSDLNEALYDVSNLGFVPTMGSLHKGHISLIKKSLKECKKTIVSIFVNPTQFNNKNDFKNYPRNKKKDLSILKKLKINFLYIPKVKDIYYLKRKSSIKLKKKDKILCAKFRKGHFEGVIDVMERLTKIIKPQKVYLGEKDFQQLFLVNKYMPKQHNIKITSFIPASIHSSKIYSIPGFPFMGNSSFAKTLVKGNSRVPNPANGIIACLII